MMKRVFVIWLMLALALAVLPASAQEATDAPGSEHPLLQMLGMIPDTSAALDGIPLISYVDYRAVEQARPGVPTYDSWQAWQAALDTRDDAVRLWSINSTRINVGPQFLRYLNLGNETPELVGFDLFDIDRGLTFGTPPALGTIFAGDFDAGAIERAFVARDYAATEQGDVLLLRRADGEDGTAMDLASRNPANPFGGDLGRKEPIAVVDGLILSSASDALVDAMAAAGQGEQRSFLSRPSIAAAAEAITQGDALLLQAAFLDPADVAVASFDPTVLLQVTPGAIDESLLTPQAVRSYGPLPFYTMSVLADLQDGADQVALVALVYDTEAEAQAAADEMTSRLTIFRDEQRGMTEPLIELIEGAQAAQPEVFFSASTGKYVALASVRYPMPDSAPVNAVTGAPVEAGSDEPTSFLPSGRLYREWIAALYSRALDFLAVVE